MTTLILAQIPYSNIAAPITADQLSLIRMDNDIIDRNAMRIVALHVARACIPDLDRAVFTGGYHPFPLAVEGYACYVGCVAVEGQDGVGVGRFYVVEFYRVVAGGGEVAFVRGYAEAVYLGVWVWDCARADS
jgi:hypothetical protein